MKKILCLLLCLLLFFCSACQKEELPEKPNADVPPTPSEEFVPEIDADSFYTYDGDLHNIYVNVALTAKELTSPVTTLSFELKNDSDYFVDFTDEIAHGHTWEKWENGIWVSFTVYTGSGKTEWEETSKKIVLGPHKTYSCTEKFAIPLEAGVYRLRKKYRLTNAKEKPKPFIIEGIPGVQCVTEAYFSVSPTPSS